MSTWQIDGTDVLVRPDLEASPTGLGLSFEVDVADAESTWRAYEPTDVERVTGVGGAYKAFSTRGASAVTLSPASGDTPPSESSFDVHITGYSEQQVAPTRVVISLDLARVTTRSSSHTAVSETGAYELALATGTIGLGTEAVDRIPREGQPTGAEFTLSMLLDDNQAATVMDNANRPAAVTARSIPDGDDQLVDTTTDDSHTVDLTVPPAAPLVDQTAIITDWRIAELAKGGPHRWQCEVTLRKQSEL